MLYDSSLLVGFVEALFSESDLRSVFLLQYPSSQNWQFLRVFTLPLGSLVRVLHLEILDDIYYAVHTLRHVVL